MKWERGNLRKAHEVGHVCFNLVMKGIKLYQNTPA